MNMGLENQANNVQAVLKTLADQHKISEISRRSGIKLRSFYDWIANGSTNGTDMLAISSWLVENGYLADPQKKPDPDKPPDPLKVMANELRALADVLDSEYPRELRAERAIGWINGTVKNAQSIVNILRKNL